MREHRVTRYVIRSPRLTETLNLAVVTDLHNGAYADVLPAIAQADALLIVGDMVNRHRRGRIAQATGFVRDVTGLVPCFFSLGNHEMKDQRDWEPIRKEMLAHGVTILDNTITQFHGIALGGLTSVSNLPYRERKPCLDVPERLSREAGFRLLMCHHPEYMTRWLRPYALDLVIAGHAHGGQMVVAGHGLYAPGQGILPRLTAGFYEDGHLLVSRGMTNTAGVPRFRNPCEMLLLRLEPGTTDERWMQGDD